MGKASDRESMLDFFVCYIIYTTYIYVFLLHAL